MTRSCLVHALKALNVRCAWYECRGFEYPKGLIEARQEIAMALVRFRQ